MNKQMMKGLVPLAVSLVLTACAVGPNFKRPDAPGAERYTKETPAQSLDQQVTLGQAPPVEWWTLFQSDELNALMKTALSDNPRAFGTLYSPHSLP